MQQIIREKIEKVKLENRKKRIAFLEVTNSNEFYQDIFNKYF